jgi:hypothetical protein
MRKEPLDPDIPFAQSRGLMLRKKGPMEKKRKPRGRPRKKEGTIEFWQFVRAAATTSAYDEARESGSKHSGAVTQAVDSVVQLVPEMAISETEVKRIHAAWRPKDAQVILRFERSILTEDKAKCIREQLAASQGKGLPGLPNDNPPKSITAFTIRIAERPAYPRSNRRTPKE